MSLRIWFPKFQENIEAHLLGNCDPRRSDHNVASKVRNQILSGTMSYPRLTHQILERLKESLFAVSRKTPTGEHHTKKDTVQKVRIIIGTA